MRRGHLTGTNNAGSSCSLFTTSNCLCSCLNRCIGFDSMETRIPFYTRVTKGKKRGPDQKTRNQKDKKRDQKKKSEAMIDEHGLGRSLDAKTPLFSASRHRQTLSLFLLFSPLTKSGRQVKLSDSLDSFGFLGFSELLCRFPFFRLLPLT